MDGTTGVVYQNGGMDQLTSDALLPALGARMPSLPGAIGAAIRAAIVGVALAVLAGCGSAPPASTLTPAESAALQPADAHLAALYAQSCKSCHTSADTGAPLTGDRAAWDARWARKGEDGLIDSAIRGLNGMPPGGQCFACAPEDYRALIRFMAGRN